MKVSVVIPVFNEAEGLGKAPYKIKSIVQHVTTPPRLVAVSRW